jgi:hypothetical protein
LDYLIRQVPWRFDVAQSKSIYDEVTSSSQWLKGKRNYDNYVLITCYKELVSILQGLAYDLDQSWAALKSLYVKGRGPAALSKA